MNARTGSYSDIVMFQNDLRTYYLVETLPDNNIIIVDFDLGYYLVKSDLSRRHLFTARSYSESKRELELWLTRIAARSSRSKAEVGIVVK